MDTPSRRWMITGANGNLGKKLILNLMADSEDEVIAIVRSERAKTELEQLDLAAAQIPRFSLRVLDYNDVTALHEVAKTADRVVHLVGILKETRQATYEDAHEKSTAAILKAVENTAVKQLTYMSIVGSHPDAKNACLASKGRAEALCAQAELDACVLRVPMVLGEGDYASYALRARAGKPLSFMFRAQSLEQPIYAGDVVNAIINAGRLAINATLGLGGPEVLTRRALVQRAAAIVGNKARVISLPIGLGMAMAGLMERLMANPPVTKAMLDVLDHDDQVDATVACQKLGLDELTSLQQMLKAVLLD